jgi:hypothetical protein
MRELDRWPLMASFQWSEGVQEATHSGGNRGDATVLASCPEEEDDGLDGQVGHEWVGSLGQKVENN